VTFPLIGLTLIGFLVQASAQMPSASATISAVQSQQIVHNGASFAIQVTQGTAPLQRDGNSPTLKLGAHVVLPLVSRSAPATREAGHGAR
jgi:hypothetical protein